MGYMPVMAGLLTRGSMLPRTFPDNWSSGSYRGRSPLTVAGAVTDLAHKKAAPCSLFISSAVAASENHRRHKTEKLHDGQ